MRSGTLSLILSIFVIALSEQQASAQLSRKARGTCFKGYRIDALGKRICTGVGEPSTYEECINSLEGKCFRSSSKDRDAESGLCYPRITEDGKCAGIPKRKRYTLHRCKCIKGKCLLYDRRQPAEHVEVPKYPLERRHLLTSCDPNTGTCDNNCDSNIGGDPHLKTWSGDWYDYMGECDLILLQAPKIGLDIHVRTKIRYDYSFIVSAAIRIGDDVLEVAGWGQYYLNGVSVSGADNSLIELSGYEVVVSQTNDKQYSFELELDEDDHIYLKTFKDWVSVKVDSQSIDDYGDSVGMLGDFETGAMVSRNGTTVLADPNEFGQDWQVRPSDPQLFVSARDPKYPEKCRLPDPNIKQSRRLGETIAHAAAEKACERWGEAKDACIYDVMKSGDIEMAEAGGY